jgi:hypothetical protein
MDPEAVVDGLAGSLLVIAADPTRVGSLHHILGGYCHQFRNRLHSLKFCMYLANRSESARAPHKEPWTELESKYLELEQFVEHLQTICRPMRLSPIRFSLGAVLEERREVWSQWLDVRKRTLEIIAPESAVIGCFDPSRLTHALDALVAWRAEVGQAGTPVRVEWGSENDQLLLNWDEPGELSLESVSFSSDRPISLALPMMARVAAAHGGSLMIVLQNHLRFSLRWPREVAATG